jgi:SAM-dependent methyltransferase
MSLPQPRADRPFLTDGLETTLVPHQGPDLPDVAALPPLGAEDGEVSPVRAGFYRRRIFPARLDREMDTAETRRIRTEVCAPLVGEVVEIGFGTGHNVPYLPAAVRRLIAVEPDEYVRARAHERLRNTTVDVEVVAGSAERLPLPDASVDAALSTWTLCTVDDPSAVLAEISRVLRPGGTLHFVEHGRSPDRRVARWQRRLNPLQRPYNGGCNLDRDIVALIAASELRLEPVSAYYLAGDPRILGWTTQGRATAPPASTPAAR